MHAPGEINSNLKFIPLLTFPPLYKTDVENDDLET